MANPTHKKTNTNTTPHDQHNPIWIQKGLSAIGAIQKVEQYIQEGTKGSQIILMGLSKAFDTINRTQLWTALYKKGLPLENIVQIRHGHQNTQLCEKHKGQYGPLTKTMLGYSADQQ